MPPRARLQGPLAERAWAYPPPRQPVLLATSSRPGAPGRPPRNDAVASSDQVMVLLSTYNGARHLDDQLASLIDQQHVDWTLLWRDDGSSDDSAARMALFSTAVGAGRCRNIAGPAPGLAHLGITGSFLALLSAVPPGHHAAFADQDDVWLPGKLSRGIAALSGLPADRPALYFARQRLVDDRLRPIGLSPWSGREAGFPACLTQNLATGCTMMLNPAAVALAVACPPPPGTLHDWWCYVLVSAAGGALIADPEPVVLYRQHAGNAVGAPVSRLRRAVTALRRGPGDFMRLFRSHLDALSAPAAAGLISPLAAREVGLLQAALRFGILARLRALHAVRGLERRTVAETLLFRLWFLIG